MEQRLDKYEPIPFSGCWIWLGTIDKDGYGRMIGSTNGIREFQFAHRASYEHHKNKIKNDKQICHTCDIPSCINPAHLYEGDPATNGQDKAIRGRAKGNPRYGQDNPMSATNRAKRAALK